MLLRAFCENSYCIPVSQPGNKGFGSQKGCSYHRASVQWIVGFKQTQSMLDEERSDGDWSECRAVFIF